MSIESQVKEMLDMTEREVLNDIEIKRESHSVKESGQRPEFKSLINSSSGKIRWHLDLGAR